jgi:hypothetical protein
MGGIESRPKSEPVPLCSQEGCARRFLCYTRVAVRLVFCAARELLFALTCAGQRVVGRTWEEAKEGERAGERVVGQTLGAVREAGEEALDVGQRVAGRVLETGGLRCGRGGAGVPHLHGACVCFCMRMRAWDIFRGKIPKIREKFPKFVFLPLAMQRSLGAQHAPPPINPTQPKAQHTHTFTHILAGERVVGAGGERMGMGGVGAGAGGVRVSAAAMPSAGVEVPVRRGGKRLAVAGGQGWAAVHAAGWACISGMGVEKRNGKRLAACELLQRTHKHAFCRHCRGWSPRECAVRRSWIWGARGEVGYLCVCARVHVCARASVESAWPSVAGGRVLQCVGWASQ